MFTATITLALGLAMFFVGLVNNTLWVCCISCMIMFFAVALGETDESRQKKINKEYADKFKEIEIKLAYCDEVLDEYANDYNLLVEKIYDAGLEREIFGEERVIDYRDEEM